MNTNKMSSIVPEKIYEILQTAVNGNIENYVVSVHDANKKGEGYLGQMFFVSLREKKNGKELNFVVKQAFSEKKIRDFSPIRDVFLNEIYFYTELWPKFQKFQEVIPTAYRFKHLAKCFAVNPEEESERLLLRNLKYKGFVMHDKTKPLEKSKFEFIFRLYGRLHAISLAYKELRPEEFSKLTEGVIDVWKTLLDMPGFLDSLKMIHTKCLDSLQPGVDDKIIEKYKEYINNAVELFRGSHLTKGKYAALIHGDCWSNNMMFKYNDSGELADLRFLDFQLVKLGSPVCDLSYSLYSGGTKEIFDDLDHLLQIYHDSLSENLRTFGCDPNQVYPMEALKNDWEVYCHLGVSMGLMIWRGKLTYDEEVLDLTDISDGDDKDMQKYYNTKYNESAFRERTRDIILHLYENNYM